MELRVKTPAEELAKKGQQLATLNLMEPIVEIGKRKLDETGTNRVPASIDPFLSAYSQLQAVWRPGSKDQKSKALVLFNAERNVFSKSTFKALSDVTRGHVSADAPLGIGDRSNLVFSKQVSALYNEPPGGDTDFINRVWIGQIFQISARSTLQFEMRTASLSEHGSGDGGLRSMGRSLIRLENFDSIGILS